MSKVLFSLLLLSSIFVVNSLLDEVPENLVVILRVFSGTKDPSWLINRDQIKILRHLMNNNVYEHKNSTRVMGYQGFELREQNTNNIISKVNGSFTLEFFLFSTGKSLLSEKVQNHVLEQIYSSYQVRKEEKFIQSNSLNKFLRYSRNLKSNFDCDKTPIIGPDHVPEFNPDKDDGGCYVEKQWDNNCYNYGTDILTNSFAQPGRGTGQKWKENTCDDVKRASLSDGLMYIGTIYPSEEPVKGHYLALLIWPDTNFHWVRLDSNGKWSHKPGGSEVRNTDNNGLDITDPSNQDFSPWSEFCGYFLVVPSNSTVK